MDSVLLRVSFEFTPEDLADVTVRHGGGKPWLRSMRRQSVLGVGVGAWAGAMLALVIVTGLRDRDSLAGLAVAAMLIGAFAAWYEARRFEAKFRRRMLDVVNAEPSTSRVMRCDVELCRGGVRLEQQNFEMFYRWTDLVTIEDLDAGVELRFLAGYVMVRARAFATPDERANFLSLARAQAAASHASS